MVDQEYRATFVILRSRHCSSASANRISMRMIAPRLERIRQFKGAELTLLIFQLRRWSDQTVGVKRLYY